MYPEIKTKTEVIMGREAKRVPADFDWPVGEVWEGYINPLPYAAECRACRDEHGIGLAPEAKQFHNEWWGYTEFDPVAHGCNLLTKDTPAVREFSRRNVTRDEKSIEFYTKHKSNPWRNIVPCPVMTIEQAIDCEAQRLAELFNGMWLHHLNDDDINAIKEEVAKGEEGRRNWLEDDLKRNNFPFDGDKDQVAAWVIGLRTCGDFLSGVCIEARCNRAGVPYYCPVCNGDGHIWPNKEAEEAWEKWERIEPPTGPAYQVWETVTEGSPVCPPFLDPLELGRWMEEHDTSITQGTSAEAWAKFVTKIGWAPSGIGGGRGGFVSGVEYIGYT